MTTSFLEDDFQGKYYIIEDHDIEILDGCELNENVSGTSINTLNDCEYIVEVNGLEELRELEELNELKELEEMSKIILLNTLEGYEKHDEWEMREKCVNSDDKIEMKNEIINDKSQCEINTNVKEIELAINTSTVEEVIYKKHRVEILNKDTRSRIMEGVICDYTLVGRVYDPDIVLNFDDGRSFYNENFGYLMRFYI